MLLIIYFVSEQSPKIIMTAVLILILDLKKHYTAVEAKDYEELVRNTPALAIDKVKAVRAGENNRIQVAVKSS